MTDNKPSFMGLNNITTEKCLLTMFCLMLLATSTLSVTAITGLASTAAAAIDTMKAKDSVDNNNSYKGSRIQNAIDRQLRTANIPEGLEQQETKDIQAAITDTWSPFLPLEGQIRSDSSPVVIKESNFKIAVFVIGVDNSLYYKTETSAASNSYTPYIPLGGVIRANSNPAVALNFDGRLSVFVIGSDNQLWEKHQLSPGSTTWSDYVPLSGQIKANTDPTAIRFTGRIVVFVIGADNSLYVKWQTATNSNTYEPYQFLGGQIRTNGRPAVEVSTTFPSPGVTRPILEVFVIGIDNVLYHKYQTDFQPQDPWTPFESLSGQIKPNTSPDVSRNFDNRLEVFVIGADNQLYNKWQTGSGTVDSYTPYQNLLGQIGPNTDPDVTQNGDGRLEVFVVGIDNNLYHKWQNVPSSHDNYSPFESLGGVVRANSDADAEINDDRTLEVFIVGQDNQLYHKFRTSITFP